MDRPKSNSYFSNNSDAFKRTNKILMHQNSIALISRTKKKSFEPDPS